jgi:hypothetical protein
VNGVRIKFTGDARFGLVLPEAEHADAGISTTVGLVSRIFGESGCAKDA